jgi:hypothetical protein
VALSFVTIILILAVALGVGVIIQSRWALLLPLAFGACVRSLLPQPDMALATHQFRFLWSYPHWSWSGAKLAVARSPARPLVAATARRWRMFHNRDGPRRERLSLADYRGWPRRQRPVYSKRSWAAGDL